MGSYAVQIKQIIEIVLGVIIGLIAVVGFFYGGYQTWHGFTSERDDEKKKGIGIIVATAMCIVLMLLLKTPILRLAGIN